MAPRALGALLALVAAIAFVVSVASSSWWSGHPTVEGQTITAKDVRVGLLGATGCNTGGDGRCEDVEVGAGLKLAGVLELAAIGLATVLAFMLAVTAWSIGDRRRLIAHTMIVVALLALAGALVVLLVGPAIKASQQVEVPISWGVYVFGAATLAALGAAAITRNLQPEPLRLKPSAGNPMPPPPDVREILREQHDGLRPSQLGPEPMIRPGALPTTGAMRPSVPLIGGAPQLRPLYDPTNEGFVPAPASPTLPSAPPAPMSKSMIDALTGQSTPMPALGTPHGDDSGASRAKTPSAPPGRSQTPSASPPVRPHAPSASPPLRPHASSVPPPAVRAKGVSVPPPARDKGPSVPPPARDKGPSVPAPMRRASGASTPPPGPTVRGASAVAPQRPDTMPVAPRRAQTEPGPGTDPQVRPLGMRTPPPELTNRPSQPTMAHAIPPMPTAENTPPPGILPATRRGETEPEVERAGERWRAGPDDRLETALRETEYHTAVEVDAQAKAAARNSLARRGETEVDDQTTSIGDVTETGVVITPAPKILGGDARSLSSSELGVARAATEDPFRGGAHQTAPAAGPPSDELAAQRPVTFELAAQTVLSPGTDGVESTSMRIGSLTAELAAQRMTDQVAAQSAPITDEIAVQRMSDVMAAQLDVGDVTGKSNLDPELMQTFTREPGHTPIPTHGPRTAARISTAPTNLAPPRATDVAAAGPTPACPQCEAPMAWVDEHLRFYCKQCRMYF